MKTGAGIPDLTVQAQRCSLHVQEEQDSPDSDPDDFFDRQVTKDIPPHLVGEWRALAESIRASILTKNPDVRWDAIVGLTSAKQLLKEAVVQPVKYPDLFTGAYVWLSCCKQHPAVACLRLYLCHASQLHMPRSPGSLEGCPTVWSSWHWKDAAGQGGGY